jgi:hypothetical protein
MDFQKIILRAWEDEAFKQELLADPRGCIERELGVQLPDGFQIFIHEQTPTTLHLILPMKPEVEA